MKKLLVLLLTAALLLNLSGCCFIPNMFKDKLDTTSQEEIIVESSQAVESENEQEPESQPEESEPQVSKPEEEETKKPSDYTMHDFYGMTIDDVADIWGQDYTLMDSLLYGGWVGIYYEDQRCPFVFCYTSNGTVPTSCTGKEKLVSVVAYPIASDTEFFVIEDLSVVCSYEKVSSMTPGQYNVNEMEGGYTYNCEFAQNHGLVFSWNENAKVPSSIIIAYTYMD